jgi:hypothetical protein
LKFVDVIDHLTDEQYNEVMASPHATASYCLTPTSVAGRDGDFNFRYTPKGWLEMGPHSRYEHPIWDNEGEVLAVYVDPVNNWYYIAGALCGVSMAAVCGLGAILKRKVKLVLPCAAGLAIAYAFNYANNAPTVIVRAVHRIPTSEHRSVILTVPRRRFEGLSACHWWRTLSQYSPKRLVPTTLGDVYGLEVTSSKGTDYSYALKDSFHSVKINAAMESTIRTLLLTSKNVPSGGYLAVQARQLIGEDCKLTATDMSLCALALAHRPENMAVVSAMERTPAYSFAYKRSVVDDEALGKPGVRCVCPPLCGPNASIPIMGRDTCDESIATRIVAPRNSKVFTPDLYEYVAEFAGVLRDKCGSTIVPGTTDDVFAAVVRGSQLAGITTGASEANFLAELHDVQFYVTKAFDKRETATGRVLIDSFSDVTFLKNAAPRKITTPSPGCGFAFATFILPLQKLIKDLPCYAFGHTPDVVSTDVPRILHGAKTVIETDFSSFDATISEALRFAELQFYLALIEPEWHDVFRFLHGTTFGNKVRCSTGLSYLQLFARGSGFRDTSLGNTLLNMFVSFCALRRTGLGPLAAFERLGLYGGDDGLTADIDVEVYRRTCADMGLITKAATIKYGSPVMFLARVWSPGVWEGDANNMTDPLRALSKVHLTTLGDHYDNLSVMKWKCQSYVATDGNTPLLGAFCNKVLSMRGGDTKVAGHATWAARCQDVSATTYTNNSADWMEAYVVQQLNGADTSRFTRWLEDPDATLDTLPVVEIAPYSSVTAQPKTLMNGLITFPITFEPNLNSTTCDPVPTVDPLPGLDKGKQAALPECVSDDCNNSASDEQELEYLMGRGLNAPKRCRACRLLNKTRRANATAQISK